MPNHGLNEPLNRPLSDAELLAHYDQSELDNYYIPREIIPAGMVYEWKRYEVYGQSRPAELVSLRRQGWQPVPNGRHAEDWPMMPPDTAPEAPITRDGLMLMELPVELYRNRSRYHQLNARRQVQDKEAQLGMAPPGTAPRDHSPKTRLRITKGYEPINVE